MTSLKQTEAVADAAGISGCPKVTEDAPFGVVELDATGAIRCANKKAQDLIGLPIEKAVGSHFTVYIHPDDRKAAAEAFERLLAGIIDPSAVEARITAADGTSRRCACSGYALTDGGENVYHIVVMDLSDLAKSPVQDQRIHRALRSAPIVYFELEPDGHIRFANETACELVGASADDLAGKPFTKVLKKDDVVSALEPLLAVASGKEQVASSTCELVDADGAGRRFRLMFLPDGLEEGAVGRVIVPCMDVSRMALAVDGEQGATEQLDRIIAASEALAFETSQDGTLRNLWGPSELILGYAAEEVKGRPFPPYVHADDLGRASEVLGRWGGEPRGGGRAPNGGNARVRSTTCRLRRRDGTWGTFRMTASTLKAEESGSDGAIGMLRDITDDADRIVNLAERDSTISGLLGSERIWVVVCDPSGTVVMLSRAYELTTGFFRTERISRPITALFAPGANASAGAFWREEGSGPVHMRLSFAKRDDPEPCVADLEVSPIRDATGKRLGLVAIGRDVTEESKREAIELERNELAREVAVLRSEVQSTYGLDRIIGQDAKMRAIFETILAVSRTQATVLIQGETGTGKELVAKAIHYNSGRKDRVFMKVDCGALSENLLESELFGHVKGAFTGAIKDRPGRFELADTGSIFLDEVQNLSFSLQAKLLRVVQDGCFEKVGGTKTQEVDVRIIAATNANLARLVEDGQFRKDLYYRLNVIPVTLPSLKHRKGDIQLLVRSFIERYAERHTKEVRGISKEALDSLLDYDWPGNVRELENIVEQAVVFARGDVIQVEDMRLPVEIVAATDEARATPMLRPLREALEDPEKEIILESIERADGNRKKAAELLGISRSAFYEKLKKHGLSSKRKMRRGE